MKGDANCPIGNWDEKWLVKDEGRNARIRITSQRIRISDPRKSPKGEDYDDQGKTTWWDKNPSDDTNLESQKDGSVV